MSTKARHLMAFPLNRHCLEGMFRWDSFKCVAGMGFPVLDADLPEDAVLRSVHYDDSRLCFICVFSHPSFPLVEQGQCIPVAKEADVVYIRRVKNPEKWEKP